MRLPVMIFTESMEIGGTEQQMIELAKRLNRHRYQVIIACKNRQGQLVKDVEDAGIPIIELPLNSFLEINALRQLKRLVNILRERKIQILHTTSDMGNTFVALAGVLAGVPVVLTSRRDMGCFTPAKLKPIQKLLTKFTTGILVNAEHIKTKIINEENIAPNRIYKVLNGINLKRFSVNSQEIAGVRREFGLDSNTPIISVIANLKPIKGHQYFLPAFQRICGHYPNARALIVGECTESGWLTELKHQCWALGLERNVIFTGYRSDVPALLSASSLFVLPSLSEGFSNALMEAMASPLPIVATAVGGTRELIENNKHGLLIPASNSEQLAIAMEQLISNTSLGVQLANAAHLRIRDLGIDRMVAETASLYEQLYGQSISAPVITKPSQDSMESIACQTTNPLVSGSAISSH